MTRQRFGRLASGFGRLASGARTLAEDRGGVTTFVVLLVVPMLLMSALAFDGGRILTARRSAVDTAQNAALAGVQAISGPTVRQGGLGVESNRVEAAAQDYLARNGATGTVDVTAAEVTVTVTGTIDLTLLPMIGISQKTVQGRGRAELVRGVDQAETPSGP